MFEADKRDKYKQQKRSIHPKQTHHCFHEAQTEKACFALRFDCTAVPRDDQNTFLFCAVSFGVLTVLTNILRVALRDGWDPVKVRPSQSFIHILLFQPLNYRLEVFHQRGGVHFVGAYGFLEHLWPGFGRASFKDFPGTGQIKMCYTLTATIRRDLSS